jgi:hypothetical protein
MRIRTLAVLALLALGSPAVLTAQQQDHPRREAGREAIRHRRENHRYRMERRHERRRERREDRMGRREQRHRGA